MVKYWSKTDAKRKHVVELRESEDRFRILADDVPVLLWGNGLDGCNFVNRAYLEFLGVSGQVDVSHFDWAQYVHPDDRKAYLTEYLDCFRRRVPFEAVFRFRRFDGVYRWMKSVGRPRFDPAGVFLGYVGSSQDITEQKTMENELRKARDSLESTVEQRTAELRESERYLESIFEGIQEGISILDKDMNIVKTNHAMKEWYSHALPLEGKKCYEAYHGHTGACDDCPSMRAMREKSMQMSVVPYVNRSGRAGWMELYSSPLMDDRGNVVGVIEHVRDITDRKRAEDELAAAHWQFQSVIDNTPDIVYAFDLEERFVLANAALAELLGSTPEQMIGKRRHEFMPLEDADWHEANDRRAIEVGRALEFEEHSQLNGRSITWLTKKFPLRDARGRIYAVAGISADISERKQAEDALKEREWQLAESQVLTDTGSWEMDLATGEVTFSDNMLRLVGLPPGRHSYDEFRALVHPDDRDRRDASVNDSIDNGKPYDVEYCIVLPGGNVRNFHGIGKLSYDSRGTPVTFMVTLQDITERKRAEKQLIEAKAQSELYLDLMGHDINNMHQIALGYLELAQGVPPGVQHDEMIGKSIEVLQRSTQLIRNVRKLQKFNEEVHQLHEVDVGGVLHTVQREFGAVPDKNVTLNLNCEGHCFVRANELLHDVFANLVSNAIKHTGNKADINIVLDAIDDNGSQYCRVCVEDNGPGIPDDFKDVVFNRILKGTRKAKGMGLGLYLVKSLVEDYGGRVWVEDRVPGDHTKGARFVVMLPAA